MRVKTFPLFRFLSLVFGFIMQHYWRSKYFEFSSSQKYKTVQNCSLMLLIIQCTILLCVYGDFGKFCVTFFKPIIFQYVKFWNLKYSKFLLKSQKVMKQQDKFITITSLPWSFVFQVYKNFFFIFQLASNKTVNDCHTNQLNWSIKLHLYYLRITTSICSWYFILIRKKNYLFLQ